MRLAPDALAQLSPAVRRPRYDRSAQRAGIVHFGAGAFQRAHLGFYTDEAMDAGDRDWSILGVSLRSPQVRDTLAPQDGLYTVSGLNSCQSMPGMSENPQMMICRMLSRTARVVLVRDFVTVTPEKGIGLNRKFVHKKLRVMKYVTIDAMDLC